MKTITLVTGSEHKLREWRRLFPETYTLESAKIDLDEIQSLESKAIVKDKVLRAYAQLQKPVIVEDVSAGLNKLHGLPGPFIKFFEEKLGNNALYELAGAESPATVSCTIAFYDGTVMLIAVGVVKGKVVAPTEGINAFGFDYVFVPNRQKQTYAQMGPAKKDKISHRYLAIKDLARQLNDL